MPIGPCAKRRVTAVLVVGDRHFLGENNCQWPSRVCPRKPDDDYTACKGICGQFGHAEDMAIREARSHMKKCSLSGATMYLFGLEKPCPSCEKLLQENGITWKVLHVGRPSLSSLI
jgi:deoxycytidylate deaminase